VTLRSEQRINMGLRFSRELQAKDNIWPLTDCMHNKKNKRASVSSATDGKHLAPVKKRRRLLKGPVNKEEESLVKKEEEIYDVFHQDEDEPEDSKQALTVFKEEEEGETEVKEVIGDDLHQDKDETEDRKHASAVVKKEEEDEVEMKEDSEDDLPRDKDEREDGKKAPAVIKEEEEDETEVKEDGEDDIYQDERESCKKSPAAIKQEERDEVGHDNCQSAERSRRTANIVKRKYSLRSLSQKNNKKSTRSKPLRKDKGSSINLGEVNRSPMASSDEDEFGRGIESAVDEASDTSDSVDGIVDHDAAIIDSYDAQWNRMYNRLCAFQESHGHCELFWLDDRFTFILNTPTNTAFVSLLALQVTCHNTTSLTRNWAIGSRRSVPSSKMTKWFRSEKGSSTRLVSSSI
jgi:hypothetical protein